MSNVRKFLILPSRDHAPTVMSVPWSVAEKAYSVYAARYGADQSLDRIAERGGFYQEEMDDLFPGWEAESSEIASLHTQLAECYRLSGADPDGNEDWRLARDAVAEVRRMRQEYDEQAAQLTALTAERDEAIGGTLGDWLQHSEDCVCMQDADVHAPMCANCDCGLAEAIRALKRGMAQGRSDWQPIETAPKDGTAVWVCAPELVDEDYNVGGCAEAYYQDDQGWLAPKWNNYQDYYETATVHPTRWLPLPAPPTPGEQK